MNRRLLELIIIVVILILLVLKVRSCQRRQPLHRILPVSFYDIHLDTGDLFLSGDQGGGLFNIFSTTIYHHVGIIYRDIDTHQLFIWHVNTGQPPLQQLLHSDKHASVFLQPLYQFIAKDKSRCAVRKLQLSPGFQMRPWTAEWQKNMILESKFDVNVFIRAFTRTLPTLVGICQIASADHAKKIGACVDITTLTYVHLGILKRRALRQTFLSEDYTSDLNSRLPFQKGASLGPEIPLAK